jgi:AhpD family alkylhydroperoxidase
MDARLNYFEGPVGQKFVKYMQSAAKIVHDILPTATTSLIMLRASQINGCAVCTDMHFKDAVAAGETAVRLNLVTVWREATVFSEAERAALEIAEQGTRLADGAQGVTDDAWTNATKYFNDDDDRARRHHRRDQRLEPAQRHPAGDYTPGQWN